MDKLSNKLRSELPHSALDRIDFEILEALPVANIPSHRYLAIQHDPSSLGAFGYDGAQILVDAMKRASGDTPDALREAIQATRDLQGVTGKISIDADRNADKGVIVVRIEKRRFIDDATVE